MPYARVRVEDSSREASADDEGLFAICVPLGLAEFVASAEGHKEGRQAYDVRGNATMIRLVVESLEVEFREHVTHAFSIRFTAGSSTVDTVLQDRGIYLGNCSPCSFSLDSPALPDFVLLEAEWRRVPIPPPEFDSVHHVLKAGIPYDEGEEFSARTDPRPHRFLFNRSAYENASAFQRGGNYGFSGALHW